MSFTLQNQKNLVFLVYSDRTGQGRDHSSVTVALRIKSGKKKINKKVLVQFSVSTLHFCYLPERDCDFDLMYF